jgi:membrane-associated protease RseP (regulator of RpoE activity)
VTDDTRTDVPPPPPPLPPAWGPPARPTVAKAGDTPGPQNLGQSLVGLVAVAALLAVLAVKSTGAFWFVVSLFVIVFLHELGHFLTARWAGMKITQFFIGFGSWRIFSFRRGEVEYGLKPILLGAYVRIVGMHNLEEVEPADEPRSYRQQGYWQRLSVATAGSVMHFLIAFALLVGLLLTSGIERPDWWSIKKVVPGSPAAQVDLRPGDRIVAINGTSLGSLAAVREDLFNRPGQTVNVTVLRGAERQTLQVTLAERGPGDRPGAPPRGFLGFENQIPTQKASILTAPWRATRQFASITRLTFEGIGRVFSPSGLGKLSDAVFKDKPTNDRILSPVGAAQAGGLAARAGASWFFLLLANLNIFIGIINLFPLLPFDGGHVAIATYEAVRSRKGRRYHADVTKMLPFSYAIMALFLVMFVGGLYLDLAHPIG